MMSKKICIIGRYCFVSIILSIFLAVTFVSQELCLASSPNISSRHRRQVSTDEDIKDPLYFLVLAPYPDSGSFKPSWAGGPAVVPAAMVARDLINKREDILKEYTIHFLVSDSGCNVVSKAVSNVTSGLFYSGKNIVGIIGPACSEATLAIAPLLSDSRFSLLQIAATAAAPNLTDLNLYPNTFRPIASALGYIDFFLSLINRKNYRKVGAVYEVARKFQAAVYSQFESALYKEGIQLTSVGIFDYTLSNFIKQFRNKIKIIFVISSIDITRNLLCLALKHDMLYPNYQFFFINRVSSNFMTDVRFDFNGITLQCSQKDMERAVIGVVFADFRLTRRDRDNITDAGISYNDFSEEYREALDLHLQSLGLTKAINTEHHSNYFDATWALAWSLNNSLPRLKERGLSLSNYKYGMPEITEIVREELLKLSFEGMRGRVEFSEKTHDGINTTVFNIYQALDGKSYGLVGEYNPTSEQPLNLFSNESLIDQDSFNLVFLNPHISLGVLTTAAATLLFIVVVTCHILNVVWRQHRTVKASSPRLNHFLFAGCYLSLVGVVLYTDAYIFVSVSETSGTIINVHCGILQWTGTMAFSLIFGTIGVKTWRIYCIFRKYNALPMEQLGDKTLIPIALLPFAVDVLVNLLWTSIDPLKFTPISHEQSSNLHAIASCQTRHKNLTTVWALCVAVPKGVIIIIVLYLGIAVRQVAMKEFKQTTKSVVIFIFSLTILTGTLLPIFFIFQYTISPLAVSVRYVSFCLFELGVVVLCLALVLLPPLIPPVKERIAGVQSVPERNLVHQ